jgi:hypothetical protein
MAPMSDFLRYRPFLWLLTIVLQLQLVFAEQPLYIGVQPRNLPYMSYEHGGEARGILVNAARELCREIEEDCVFYAPGSGELLTELRYLHLDAVILSDQFVSEHQARDLFFYPVFCKIKPVFIWGKHADPVLDKDKFMYQSVGVQENSYLEYYLQNNLPLNTQIVPYELMENAVFDLLHGAVDVLFSTISFFETRAKGRLAKKRMYVLPTVAFAMEGYVQPEKMMTLVIRDNNLALKEKLLRASRQKETRYCAEFLPNYFKTFSKK